LSNLPPTRALCLPLAFALTLMAFGLLDRVHGTPRLLGSFLGVGGALLAWIALLGGVASARGRTFTLEIVLRKQHYLQACAQCSVLMYWGLYWPQVYDAAYLITAQLVFAYAFDLLIGWSRRDTYTLGFGPFPIIFSINLFLWFRPEWFYLQFLMVALGLAAKELIRWEKGGRPSHIFNPSSFPLAIFSVGLIATGMSDATWGQDIAITQFFPPHMYLMLFLVGLPGQFFFGVTTMTMSAVVSTYLFGLAYFAVTGVYFFYDSYIPIAVFLGMHLLFTDPSTSPRSELGRIIFGVLYGLSSVALYQLLGAAGVPTFYDKLLQVPILNLSIRSIDRLAGSSALRGFDPAAISRWMAPRQRHLAYMGVWAVVFAAMSAVQGVGDRHEGQWVPFWQRSCEEDRPTACEYLATLQTVYCNAGSGWACNEAAILGVNLERAGRRHAALNRAAQADAFERGCSLGFEPACRNITAFHTGASTWVRSQPMLDDYPIVLRGSKGAITDRTAAALYARACDQGWPDTCGRADRQ
jgi:hypothetical protein